MNRWTVAALSLLVPISLAADATREPPGMRALGEEEMERAIIPLEKTRRYYRDEHGRLIEWQERYLLEDGQFRREYFLLGPEPPRGLTPPEEQIRETILEVIRTHVPSHPPPEPVE